MKEYLCNTFKYNDWANRKLLEVILTLPEKQEAIKLFSHLITSQDKWFNRIRAEVNDKELAWFGPVFDEKELQDNWSKSIFNWINFLEKNSSVEIENYIEFKKAGDGKSIRVKIKNVMLQLNYHSIHHRAQINSLISKQGIKPPQTDFIFTALEEVS